jgi:hypothetical protein
MAWHLVKHRAVFINYEYGDDAKFEGNIFECNPE